MKTVLGILLFFMLGCSSAENSSTSNSTRTKRYYRCSNDCQLRDEYDFIIAGGGTAGCIVASRLSEIPEFSVLLIEGGIDEEFENQIPYFFDDLFDSRFDSNLTSTRQNNMCLSKGGICDLHGSNVVGGLSAVNQALYFTGNYRDFDNWEALGNPSWAWNSILPYFQKAEHYIPCDRDGGSLGRYGPLAVNEIEPYWLTPYLLRALGTDLGLPQVFLNDAQTGGYDTSKVLIYQGERMSTNKAYIKPVLNRPNLDVVIESVVTKVVITNKRATGVEFVQNGVAYTINARKEVVITEGPVGSPQILMLSGVGPADHLQQFGIPVIQDSPGVGYNLQDQPGIRLRFRMTQVDDESDDDVKNWVKQYFINRTGPLTLPERGQTLVSIQTNSTFSTLDNPDLVFTCGSGDSRDIFTITGCVGRALSRGRVYLRSSSPFVPPFIDPNYLSCPRDLELMRQLAQFMFQLADTSTMRELGVSAATYIPEYYPDCANSNDLFTCLAQYYGFSQQSLCGTCKMGPRSDPEAVVNWELKVYGIEGLRVVDQSIMPIITSALVQGPTGMIAEKASDMIKLTHNAPGVCMT